MNCADVEILLADYLDGALDPAGRTSDKFAFESHLQSCATCAALAADARAAIGFIGRAANPEAPPELVTKILFEVTNGPSRAVVKPSLTRRLFGKWLEPVLRPRFVMSMAMTVLSFAMLGQLSGIQVRQLKPADLDPVKVWMSAEDQVLRIWERGVKNYESLRLVYDIQSRLKEWTDEQQQQQQQEAPAANPPAQQNTKGAGR